ncbi:MAG TPA: hypothetical protein PKG54_12210 [Phycisphaerae bacterium]|jgi:hypothetical protein|nr:hypothetical protein [Phycisphaerae bacterium]HOB75275.1 hypothetical protein [Phycisphaerae bacterium]HOJ55049.1 hypothetical protein [Phycisphaerae bacterium]HOL27790.1 hypothetical protein [Phycisphaerae bacterium]HPP21999.1 hypothetical protein [Phycisphaerae bacterium]
MSSVASTSLNLDASNVATASTERRKVMLRQAVDEMVGVTFFGEMLKMARNARLKGDIGHGGRGEEIFGAQLDQELARRAGAGMKNSLSETIYNRLVKNI